MDEMSHLPLFLLGVSVLSALPDHTSSVVWNLLIIWALPVKSPITLCAGVLSEACGPA